MKLATKKTVNGPGPVIYLVLDVPTLPPMAFIFPESNFAGASILARLLDAHLAQAGHSSEPANFGGPLNSVIMRFGVREPHEAARTIVESLASQNLSAFAHIFRWDEDELVCRRLFPPGKPDILKSHLDALLADNTAKTKLAISQSVKLLPPTYQQS